MEIYNLVAKLTGDNRGLKQTLRDSGSRLKKFAGTAQGALASIGGLVAGKILMSKINESMRGVLQFQDQFVKSTSIMIDVSEGMRAEMRDVALSMSADSKFSADQLAESYYFLASAGLDAKQQIAALGPVTEFATAGAFDLATATDLLTDAQSALGKTVEDAAENQKNMIHLSDLLIKANTLANASAQQFSEALTNEAGQAMRQFGIEMENGIAVLAAFADQGIKGNVAGSLFGRAVRLMIKAYQDEPDAFKKMGLQIFDASGAMRNFADIASDLERILGPLSTEQRALTLNTLGFQARTQQAILPLVGMSDAIREYEAGLRSAGGVTAQVADNQMQSLDARVNKLTNAWEAFKVRAIEPAANAIAGPFIDALHSVVKWGAEGDSTIRTLAGGFFAVGGYAVSAGLQLAGFAGSAGMALVGLEKLGVNLTTVGPLIARLTPSIASMTAALKAAGGTAAAVGVAYAGWEIGKWIGEVTGLHDKIAETAVKWMELLGLADKERSTRDATDAVAAMQDVRAVDAEDAAMQRRKLQRIEELRNAYQSGTISWKQHQAGLAAMSTNREVAIETHRMSGYLERMSRPQTGGRKNVVEIGA